MRLPFGILQQALEQGPNEVEKSEAEQNGPKIKRDSHAGSKDDDKMQHQDSKLEGAMANMRIEEVEQEHEQTCNEDSKEVSKYNLINNDLSVKPNYLLGF